MSVTLKKRAADVRSRIYRQMLERGAWKYRSFLRYLRLFRYFSMSNVRGSFLENYYVLMRYLDDIVDGDLPLPVGHEDVSSYIMEKIEFTKRLGYARDDADLLILYCNELGLRMRQDFSEETMDIMSSLHFDALRRGSGKIFKEEALARHFHQMDIRGTIRATLKIFNDDPDKYLLLEPLGMACRYQYDLEDFEADIRAGYVNISAEECRVLGISDEDLKDIHSPGVVRWYHYRARKGLDLLEQHDRLLPEGGFTLLERMTFPLVYANPARKRFEKVLIETSHVRDNYKEVSQRIRDAKREKEIEVLSE